MAKLIGEEYVGGHKAAVCQNQAGQKLHLFQQEVTLKNGEHTLIYLWIPENAKPPFGAKACKLPVGHVLSETSNGFVVLKRS